MFVFIFEDVEQLTDNYHSGGGLVVVAANEDDARKLASANPSISLSDAEWRGVKKYRLAEAVEPELYIFPDAGCC